MRTSHCAGVQAARAARVKSAKPLAFQAGPNFLYRLARKVLGFLAMTASCEYCIDEATGLDECGEFTCGNAESCTAAVQPLPPVIEASECNCSIDEECDNCTIDEENA